MTPTVNDANVVHCFKHLFCFQNTDNYIVMSLEWRRTRDMFGLLNGHAAGRLTATVTNLKTLYTKFKCQLSRINTILVGNVMGGQMKRAL